MEKIIEELERHFGEFSVVHGKNQDYLGMNIKIRYDKKVSIDMIKQIKEIIEGFSEKLTVMLHLLPEKNYLQYGRAQSMI